MPDYRVTIEGGDLKKAHRALEGVGAFRLGPGRAGYTDSEDEDIAIDKLVVLIDADSEGDATSLAYASLPQLRQSAAGVPDRGR